MQLTFLTCGRYLLFYALHYEQDIINPDYHRRQIYKKKKRSKRSVAFSGSNPGLDHRINYILKV